MAVIPHNERKHTELGKTTPLPSYTSSATSETSVLTVLNVELEYLTHFFTDFRHNYIYRFLYQTPCIGSTCCAAKQPTCT
jgi:hypothetical protein